MSNIELQNHAEVVPMHSAEMSPASASSDASDAPKPRRSRVKSLTRVDRRSSLGKRIAELQVIYTEACGGAGSFSAVKRLRVADAAQLRALAEQTRGAYLRDGVGNLDDIIRIERKASHAERALGIVEKPRSAGPTLAEYLAQKAVAP
jgi:hypothetical protein